MDMGSSTMAMATSMVMTATSTAMHMSHTDTATGATTAMDMTGMTGMTMGTSTGMGMDMGTATGSAGAAATSMDMSSMGMGNDCKISMLWNWNTVGTCFIAETWHVTSRGMFGGSCIGVICLVMVLEFLRRAVKEYDRFIIRQHNEKLGLANASASSTNSKDNVTTTAANACPGAVNPGFRPNIFQQAIRALLHMLQFAVAYFVMLLAMYYNGYFIICIFIGAFLGSFVFQWERLGQSTGNTSAAREATVCCG